MLSEILTTFIGCSTPIYVETSTSTRKYCDDRLFLQKLFIFRQMTAPSAHSSKDPYHFSLTVSMSVCFPCLTGYRSYALLWKDENHQQFASKCNWNFLGSFSFSFLKVFSWMKFLSNIHGKRYAVQSQSSSAFKVGLISPS